MQAHLLRECPTSVKIVQGLWKIFVHNRLILLSLSLLCFEMSVFPTERNPMKGYLWNVMRKFPKIRRDFRRMACSVFVGHGIFLAYLASVNCDSFLWDVAVNFRFRLFGSTERRGLLGASVFIHSCRLRFRRTGVTHYEILAIRSHVPPSCTQIDS